MRVGLFLDRILQPFRAPAVTARATPARSTERAAWAVPPLPQADIPTALHAGAATRTPGTLAPWQTRGSTADGSVRARFVDPILVNALTDPSDAEIAAAKLRPIDRQEKLAGITQKLIVEDEHTGRRYVFKTPDRKHQALERELVALRLRRAVGQPSVAVAAHSVQMPDGRTLHGYVKPFVESQGTLPNDPRQWTEQQKTAVLVDHLWAELTGNYDTKPVQYVVVGDSTLNIDWDHAGKDFEKNPSAPWGLLSRHKSGAIAPAAQRLLLSSWVRGEIELDTAPLWAALEHIERLSRRDFEHAVGPLADALSAERSTNGPFKTRDDLVDHLVERKDSLRWRFSEMLRRTANERDDWRLAHEGKRTGTQTRMLLSFGEARLTVLSMAMSTPIFDLAYQASQKWQAAIHR